MILFVHLMYDRQLLYLLEDNWANRVTKLKDRYNLIINEEDLASMSKESWKNLVNKRVAEYAFRSLTEQCKAMSKTKHLHYEDSHKIQKYLVIYPFEIANIIFKLRGRSSNCRNNRGDHGECRLCGSFDESQSHCINCPKTECNTPLSLGIIYGNIDPENTDVVEVVARIKRFEEAVQEIVKM